MATERRAVAPVRNFLIQLAVVLLVLAVGFLLTVIGSSLLGIGLIVGALLLLGGILILDIIHGSGPFTRKTPGVTPSIPASLPRSEADRVVVRHSPEDILGLFKGLTDVQAQRLIEPYIGKWLEVLGDVADIQLSGNAYLVGFSYSHGTPYNVTMTFEKDKWGDRLPNLKPNDPIRVLGRIGGVSRVTIVLDHCDLLPTPPAVRAIANGPDVYLTVTNRQMEAAEIRAEAIDVSPDLNANLPWPMVWQGGGAVGQSLKSGEARIALIGHQIPDQHASNPPTFALDSPLGVIRIGSPRNFTLHVRVHYGEDSSDFAVTVTFGGFKSFPMVCQAVAVPWTAQFQK